jgi:hypothetical protein
MHPKKAARAKAGSFVKETGTTFDAPSFVMRHRRWLLAIGVPVVVALVAGIYIIDQH